MKALVVYDSVYGNTEQVARAIGSGIAGDVRVARFSELDPAGLGPVDLLLIGSPTFGGRPTEGMQAFLDRIPEAAIKGVRVGTFDTRYEGRFVKMFGFAAERIAASLTAKGASLVAPPAPFIVKGKRGPLKTGELERASSWARQLLSA